MINKKKEGGFYASKVRLFLNEYDGIPLEEFCKAEKVGYNKMYFLCTDNVTLRFRHRGLK